MNGFILIFLIFFLVIGRPAHASQKFQGTCYVAQKMSCSTIDQKSIHFIFQTEFQKAELAIRDCDSKTSPVVGDISLWRATKMRDFVKENYQQQILKCAMPVVFFQNKNHASNSLETILLKIQYSLDHCNKVGNQLCLAEEGIEFRL